MTKTIFSLILICFCVLNTRAQTLTATYVELADSADYYIGKKMWREAEQVIIKALKHEPANKSNYLLWSNLGSVREQQQNFDGAIESYTIGLSSAPKSTILLTNRARAFLALGRNEDALADLDLVLQTDSLQQWPLKIRGILNASKGKFDDALRDFSLYKKHYGDDAGVEEVSGDIYSSQAEFDKSLKAYRNSLKIEPTEEVYVKIALISYAIGKIDEAAEDISEGIKKFPRKAELYVMRGLLNKSRYQTDAYESDIKMAKHLGIDNVFLKNLGISQ